MSRLCVYQVSFLLFPCSIVGDVFRPPELGMLLSACVGVGVHLLVTMALVVLLAICNVFDPTRRGAVLQVPPTHAFWHICPYLDSIAL